MIVRVTGPESSGKTTLATLLAWCLDGVYVAEQARPYLHTLGRPYHLSDLSLIWKAQAAAEDAARASGASYVVCDTGPEVIDIWARVKYGTALPVVADAVTERTYDVTLLCAPDLPWVAGPLREAGGKGERERLFERYRSLLGPGATIIRGRQRVATALNHLRPTAAPAYPLSARGG